LVEAARLNDAVKLESQFGPDAGLHNELLLTPPDWVREARRRD